jgi:hypothetical protein
MEAMIAGGQATKSDLFAHRVVVPGKTYADIQRRKRHRQRWRGTVRALPVQPGLQRRCKNKARGSGGNRVRGAGRGEGRIGTGLL